MHKKIADKMKLMNLGKSNAGVPPGDPNWKVKAIKESQQNYQPGKYNKWFEPKFSDLKRGSCLIAERLAKMVIRKGFTLEERKIFGKMLFYQKKAFAFNFTH